MRKHMFIIAILVLLLALPAAVFAQVTVPQEVAEAFAADISNGNTDEAIALLDPGVEVTSDQGNTTGAEGTPEYVENPQQTYSGEAEAACLGRGYGGAESRYRPGRMCG